MHVERTMDASMRTGAITERCHDRRRPGPQRNTVRPYGVRVPCSDIVADVTGCDICGASGADEAGSVRVGGGDAGALHAGATNSGVIATRASAAATRSHERHGRLAAVAMSMPCNGIWQWPAFADEAARPDGYFSTCRVSAVFAGSNSIL